MDLIILVQFQPTITGLDINLSRKQTCDLKGCNNKSFTRFILTSQQGNIPSKYVCLQCSSSITGYNFFQLGLAEQYVLNVKPHFKQLKNQVNYYPISNHKNKDVTGKLTQDIGDLRILITEFQNNNYGLIINGKPYKQNLLKSFPSYKKVYDFTVRVINNIYSDRILESIRYGTGISMP